MAYAIFKASGFQYRAEPGDVIRLPRMDVEVGGTVTFDEVLLGADNGEVLIGRPTVKDAAVKAEVVGHDRADKIVVWKFKRRKNYRRKQGHRQDYTEIRVNEIDLGNGRVVKLEEKAPAEPKARKPRKRAKPKAEAAVVEPAEKETAAKPRKGRGKKKTPESEAAPEPKAEAKAEKKPAANKKPKAKAAKKTKKKS